MVQEPCRIMQFYQKGLNETKVNICQIAPYFDHK
jgi:hypothetical protein